MVDISQKLKSIAELEGLRNTIQSKTDKYKTVIHVCMTGCRAYGATAVHAALAEAVKARGLA